MMLNAKETLYKLVCFTLLIGLFVVLNSSTFWQWVFPVSYTQEVADAAQYFEVDPLLVLAIVQNESAFRQDSLSRKGARGLMQLMPETARWINEMSGLDQESEEYIDDPQANILLGSWYLSYLLDRFDGDELLAIAAYNAGEGNVNRWLNEGVWNGTWRDVEQIPFGETRHYVIRVHFYYQQYKSVYGDDFTHVAPRSGPKYYT